MRLTRILVICLCCFGVALSRAAGSPKHILILSLDGMHALDLARFVRDHPDSAMAGLLRTGVNFTSAKGAQPADSFPGMMAIATGGSPSSTGVYFDISTNTLSVGGTLTLTDPLAASSSQRYYRSIEKP